MLNLYFRLKAIADFHFYKNTVFTADKARAVYMAEPVADFIAVTFTAILFFFQFRKALNQIQ